MAPRANWLAPKSHQSFLPTNLYRPRINQLRRAVRHLSFGRHPQVQEPPETVVNDGRQGVNDLEWFAVFVVVFAPLLVLAFFEVRERVRIKRERGG
jgi:hypothetical protein